MLARLPAAEPPLTVDYAAKLMAEFDGPARAGALVSALDLAAARKVAATVTKVGAVQLMPAHRGNSPRNWIVDDWDAVSVIDSGSADYEPRWVDIYRMRHREWLGRPELRDAFLAGYGRDIDDATATLLRAYGARMSLSTIVWATDHGDAPLVAQRLRTAAPGA